MERILPNQLRKPIKEIDNRPLKCSDIGGTSKQIIIKSIHFMNDLL